MTAVIESNGMNDFRDKVVLVTGGARGVGAATVRSTSWSTMPASSRFEA